MEDFCLLTIFLLFAEGLVLPNTQKALLRVCLFIFALMLVSYEAE